jgi:hypothetical protein
LHGFIEQINSCDMKVSYCLGVKMGNEEDREGLKLRKKVDDAISLRLAVNATKRESD